MFFVITVAYAGWSTSNSPDEAQLKELGDDMAKDILDVHGKIYTSQKSIQLYMTTGTASDWFYSDDANANNKYRAAGYTFELRDTGQYGFELPPQQVCILSGQERESLVVSSIFFYHMAINNLVNKNLT